MGDVGVQINIDGLERAVKNMDSRLAGVEVAVAAVGTQVVAIQSDLVKLQQDFQAMIMEQRRAAALEQATTELVSVRQAMEKKFGNYSKVRNTMIGILQATDAALVRKVTVSTVSEELMISTPDYWLAPVLVALAAWIGNDRDLANRAITEAVKRDNEHTSLTMALICRRNHRTQTSYEWLSRYFATQDAANFDEDSMVYVDAYINGIFGPDEKHLCDEYISHWLDQVREAQADFDDNEITEWSEYFNKFNVDEGEKFPALRDCVKEFGYINDYLGRVDAVDDISSHFNYISDSEVDHDKLAKEVDKHLMKLVSSDDPKERDLRSQEEYLMAVKACQGNIEAAREVINKRRQAEIEKTMNIVDQLSHVIRDDSQTAPVSQKKTAVSLLRGYINNGYNQYIEEKKAAFPKEIHLELNGWNGTVGECGDSAALKQSYHASLAQQKAEETETLAKTNNPKGSFIVAGVFAAIMLLMMIAGVAPLGVIAAIVAIVFMVKGLKKNKDYTQGLAELDEKYTKLQMDGDRKIDDCLTQWQEVKEHAKTAAQRAESYFVA